MAPLIELFLIVTLIYLYECLQIVPRGAVAVQSLVVGYRLVRASPIGFLPRRGMLLAMPLPPLGTIVVAAPWPVVPSEDGVVAEGGTRLGWEALREARTEEAIVYAGKARIARAASEPAARALAALLGEMAKAADPAAREALLDRALRERLSVEKARARLRVFRRAAWFVRVPANLLFLCVFVGAPLILLTPLIEHWRPLATTAIGAWLLAGTGFFDAAARVFGDGAEGPPAGKKWGVVLMPLSTIRATDVLALYAAAPFDPWAVGAALLPRARFEERTRQVLADLHYREPADDDADDGRAYFEARLRPALAGALAAIDLRPAALFLPPAPEHPESRSFCPRCRAQHVLAEGRCSTCPGMPLLSMTAPAPPRLPFVDPPPPPVVEPAAAQAPADASAARSKGKRRRKSAG